MNAKITDFLNQRENDNGTPFPDYDITADAYITIDNVLNMGIRIYEAKPYTNDKGPGVFVLFMTDEGEFRYIATHSIGIVSALSAPAVQEHLADPAGSIDCRIVKRKSKTSARMVYALAD